MWYIYVGMDVVGMEKYDNRWNISVYTKLEVFFF